MEFNFNLIIIYKNLCTDKKEIIKMRQKYPLI